MPSKSSDPPDDLAAVLAEHDRVHWCDGVRYAITRCRVYRLAARAQQAEAQVARYDQLSRHAPWLAAKLRQTHRIPGADRLREGETL